MNPTQTILEKEAENLALVANLLSENINDFYEILEEIYKKAVLKFEARN